MKKLKREFTLHFATINTIYKTVKRIAKYSFTLHFATINTTGS